MILGNKKSPVWVLCLTNNVVRSAGSVWRKPGGGIVHSAFFIILMIFVNTGLAIFHSPPLLETPLILFWVLHHSVLSLSSATIFKWFCATKMAENGIKRTKEGSGFCCLLFSSAYGFLISPNVLKIWMWKTCWNYLKTRVCLLAITRYFFFKVWIT